MERTLPPFQEIAQAEPAVSRFLETMAFSRPPKREVAGRVPPAASPHRYGRRNRHCTEHPAEPLCQAPHSQTHQDLLTADDSLAGWVNRRRLTGRQFFLRIRMQEQG
jgi:hypothetical protein